MRVGILSLIHESNTFAVTPTTIDMFRRDELLIGDDVRHAYEGGHNQISGFLAQLEGTDIEAVPIFHASTPPSGTITHGTCDELVRLMFEALDAAGELDGFLVSPHGANVGEGDDYRDLDGFWLTRLREHAGHRPIVCVIDPHANLSARMVEACDATIAYRSNAQAPETHWFREDFDALVEAAIREPDVATRRALYQKAARILSQEGGAIIPVFQQIVAAVRSGCSGYEPHVQLSRADLRKAVCD